MESDSIDTRIQDIYKRIKRKASLDDAKFGQLHSSKINASIEPSLEAIMDLQIMADSISEIDKKVKLNYLPAFVHAIYGTTQSIIKYLENDSIVFNDELYNRLKGNTKGQTDIDGNGIEGQFLHSILNICFSVYHNHIDVLKKDIELFGKDHDMSVYKSLKKTIRSLDKLWTIGGKKKEVNGQKKISNLLSRMDKRHKDYNCVNSDFQKKLDSYKTIVDSIAEYPKDDEESFYSNLHSLFTTSDTLLRLKEDSLLSEENYSDYRNYEDNFGSPVKSKMIDSLEMMVDELDEARSCFTDKFNDLLKDPFKNYGELEEMSKDVTTRIKKVKDASRIAGFDISDYDELFEEYSLITSKVTRISANVNIYNKLLNKISEFQVSIDENKYLPEKDLKLKVKDLHSINSMIINMHSEDIFSDSNFKLIDLTDSFLRIVDQYGDNLKEYLSFGLNLEEFRLSEINDFQTRYDSLHKTIDDLCNLGKGPIQCYFSKKENLDKFKGPLKVYKEFFDLCQKLSTGVNFYRFSKIDEVSEKNQEISNIHNDVISSTETLNRDMIECIDKVIERQKDTFRSYVNKLAKAILDDASELDGADLTRIQKNEKLRIKLESIRDSYELELLDLQNEKLYNEYLSSFKKENQFLNSMGYKLVKSIKNIIRHGSITVGESTKKHYVLDTSVLVHNPNCITEFKGHNVIIPIDVIEELDDLKHNPKKKGIEKEVRMALDRIEFYRAQAKNKESDVYEQKMNLEGVVINKYGGRIITAGPLPPGYVSSLDLKVPDNRIIEQAIRLKPRFDNIKILSNDTSFRIKSDIMDIAVDDLKSDKITVEPDDLFKGYRTIYVESDFLEHYRNDSKLNMNDDDLINNEVLILTDKTDPMNFELVRYNEGKYHKLKFADKNEKVMKHITPRNIEQLIAFEALMNPNIQCVALSGRAGTGKDFISLASGLHQVMHNEYKKVLASRVFVEVGESVGYLPGDIEEKSDPYFGFIYENLESIGRCTKQKDEDQFMDNMMMEFVEKMPINWLRGRSIPLKYIILSEAQNITPHQMKTLITRADEGTKIIVNGDPEQIDTKYLTEYNCGLNHLIEHFAGQDNFAAIKLTKTERSRLSEQGSQLL